MKTFSYIIKDELGIHARPAGLLVRAASCFKSNVTITAGEKSVDMKRILAVMGLGVKTGNKIVITIDGEDETEALKALEEFFNKNL